MGTGGVLHAGAAAGADQRVGVDDPLRRRARAAWHRALPVGGAAPLAVLAQPRCLSRAKRGGQQALGGAAGSADVTALPRHPRLLWAAAMIVLAAELAGAALAPRPN